MSCRAPEGQQSTVVNVDGKPRDIYRERECQFVAKVAPIPAQGLCGVEHCFTPCSLNEPRAHRVDARYGCVLPFCQSRGFG